MQDKKNKDSETAKQMWELSSIGIEFSSIVVGSVFLGNFIDKQFQTTPWWILAMSTIGFFIAIYHIMGRVNPKNKK